MRKHSHIYRTNYLNHHIAIAQSEDRTWSYTIHSPDWQQLVQMRGLATESQAWEAARSDVDKIVGCQQSNVTASI